jgi:endonuclease/exonuclease/phosphatase family metal-dependent hydrolase
VVFGVIMTGLTLLTLNIEGNRHLDRVRDVIATHLPDVVCLQEVFEPDCAALAAIGGYEAQYNVSALMPDRAAGAGRTHPWGVAMFARAPLGRRELHYYTRDVSVPFHSSPNAARRFVLVTELEHEGLPYRIATTHFTWSPDGEATDEQREDFAALRQVLARYPDYVLCGDVNAPRGREIFAKFLDELRLTDHLPPEVTTTLDPAFHYAGALELVVDTVFSTPHYAVEHVQVLEGVSDHKGILATLERRV